MQNRNHFFTLLFTVFQVPLLLLSLYFLLNQFLTTCPNKDVLTWDADLRFITTLNLMDALRTGNLPAFFWQILDTPTWPVLRNLLEMPFFFLFGHSQTLDVYFTFATFFLLFPVTLWILFWTVGIRHYAPILLFAFWTIILQSPPLLAYSFSGMLEIQGSLFYLLSLFYFYRYLNSPEDSKEKNLFFLAIFSFALFSSKYPYGYLFLFSSGALVFFIYRELSILFVIRYLVYIGYRWKKNPRIWAFFLLFLPYLLLPQSMLPGKSKNYLKYLLALLLVSDFVVYFFRQKAELLNLGYQKIIGVIQWLVLPIVAWVLIHPDRFSSSGSTIQHVQVEGHAVGAQVDKGLDYYLVFVHSFLREGLEHSWMSMLLLILVIIAALSGGYRLWRHKRLSLDFVLSFSCLITIIGLTFLTPNHQARHIYHLYPAMILAAVLFLYQSFSYPLSTATRTMIYLGWSILFSYPIFASVEANFRGKLICFTGQNTKDYALPRWIEKTGRNLLTQNTLHINAINPNHVNKADTEMLLARIAYENHVQFITNPGRKKLSITDFPQLLYTGNICSTQTEQFISFAKNIRPSALKLKKQFQITNGCIQLYKILQNKDE